MGNGLKRMYAIALVAIAALSAVVGTWIYFQNSFQPDSQIIVNQIITVNESSGDYLIVYFEPDELKLNQNETAIVEVVVKNTSLAEYAELNMVYDGSVVKIVKVSSEYRMNHSFGYVHNHRVMNYLSLRINFSNESRDSVATITLKALRNGKTELSFSLPSHAYDRNGNPVNLKLHSAVVTVGDIQNSKTEIQLDLVDLLLFIVFYATIPLMVVFLLVSAAVGILFLLIAKYNGKRFEDYLYQYFAASLMVSFIIYISAIALRSSLTAGW